MPASDVGRRAVKRGVTLYLAIFVSGWLAFILILVVTAAFDLPVEPVAASMVTLWILGTGIFAVIIGRRTRADLERTKRGAAQTPNGGDKP